MHSYTARIRNLAILAAALGVVALGAGPAGAQSAGGKAEAAALAALCA